MSAPLNSHKEEIQRNLKYWSEKKILRIIYREFYEQIAKFLHRDLNGQIVELGSGIGNIREVISDCLRTDLFHNPWIDKVENAYSLSFADHSLSHLILFDVFHHLRYPGTAFREFGRVLCPHGRVIIFDPFMGLLGFLVWGWFHHEPVAIKEKIEWYAPPHFSISKDVYYAAQGNATRIFYGKRYQREFDKWRIIEKKRMAAIPYVASGGYSRKQLYPDSFYPLLKRFDSLCNCTPWLFGTRLLVVLEKKERPSF